MRGRGVFITFEGGEGAGKSTQIRRLADSLRRAGHEVLTTREPGGSPGAEALRHVILSGGAEAFGVRMEAMLFAAARNDHVETVIRPALAKGFVVLCDRFIDSSRVYQGVTGNLEPQFIDALERVAINGVLPDVTLILDLPADLGLARAKARSVRAGTAENPDRFEKEEAQTHEIRRQGFLDIARDQPARCRVIDAGADPDKVARDILAVVSPLLAERGGSMPSGAAKEAAKLA